MHTAALSEFEEEEGKKHELGSRMPGADYSSGTQQPRGPREATDLPALPGPQLEMEAVRKSTMR